MKLSICLVTMNRAGQLAEALKSCLSCELPSETEFVIIDNASTDNTGEVVKEILGNCGYKYYYEKLPENLGVGGGRNYAYNKSRGEFVYMLDDDAVIDVETCNNFFVKAIEIFKNNEDIVSLTSQIYDTAWEKNRVSVHGTAISDDLYRCFIFCGGSHFLRKTFFVESPYLSNKYGYEELPPSLMAVDNGKINAFCPDMRIIHKPAVNKWNWNEDKNVSLLINTIALPYVIKRNMYPRITYPLLTLFYNIRKRMYFPALEARRRVDVAVKEILKNYKFDYRIKFKTLCFLVKTFGKTAL